MRAILEVENKTIIIYQTKYGLVPFEDWLNKLRDIQGRANIRKRLNRIRSGNLGDCKLITRGVLELRIDFGPGYRVYFGILKNSIVVLLCGGNKSTQKSDIKLAKAYLEDYLN